MEPLISDADNNDVTDGKLKAVIQSYEVQVKCDSS